MPPASWVGPAAYEPLIMPELLVIFFLTFLGAFLALGFVLQIHYHKAVVAEQADYSAPLTASPPDSITPESFPPSAGWHRVLVLGKPYDGDTCTVGFIIPVKARLHGIDTPELKEEGGGDAQRALATKLCDGKIVTAYLYGREKYGRTLMEFYDGDQSINQWMIDSGFAKPLVYK